MNHWDRYAAICPDALLEKQPDGFIIYALIDPSNEHIRYIGLTNQPQRRYARDQTPGNDSSRTTSG